MFLIFYCWIAVYTNLVSIKKIADLQIVAATLF